MAGQVGKAVGTLVTVMTDEDGSGQEDEGMYTPQKQPPKPAPSKWWFKGRCYWRRLLGTQTVLQCLDRRRCSKSSLHSSTYKESVQLPWSWRHSPVFSLVVCKISQDVKVLQIKAAALSMEWQFLLAPETWRQPLERDNRTELKNQSQEGYYLVQAVTAEIQGLPKDDLQFINHQVFWFYQYLNPLEKGAHNKDGMRKASHCHVRSNSQAVVQ